MFDTFGQRQALGIGGRREDAGDPWYVVDKDIPNNTLVVAQGKDHPLLYRQQLQASQLHWIHTPPDAVPFHCSAKTRYRQSDQTCTITRLQEDHCEVVFEQPQRAITPGQSVVFYQADECLGGGIIEASSVTI
jgi:tRNA-specific 2-thiouridylase